MFCYREGAMMLRFLLDRLRLAGLVAVLGGAMVVVGQSVQFLDLLNLSLFGHDAEAPAQAIGEFPRIDHRELGFRE